MNFPPFLLLPSPPILFLHYSQSHLSQAQIGTGHFQRLNPTGSNSNINTFLHEQSLPDLFRFMFCYCLNLAHMWPWRSFSELVLLQILHLDHKHNWSSTASEREWHLQEIGCLFMVCQLWILTTWLQISPLLELPSSFLSSHSVSSVSLLRHCITVSSALLSPLLGWESQREGLDSSCFSQLSTLHIAGSVGL